MNVMHRLVPGLLAGSLLVGSAGSAFAAQAKATAHRATGYGQISNLTATGFTLTVTPKKAGSTTGPKTVQVMVNSSTKWKARAGTTGPIGNGDFALVVGNKGPSGIAATRITYSSTAFKPHRLLHRVAGTVNSALTTSTSVTITTAKGKSLTFAITPQTRYRVNKQVTTKAPNFANGEKVRVVFLRNAATKMLTARTIVVVP